MFFVVQSGVYFARTRIPCRQSILYSLRIFNQLRLADHRRLDIGQRFFFQHRNPFVQPLQENVQWQFCVSPCHRCCKQITRLKTTFPDVCFEWQAESEIFSRYMYRSFLSLESDVICRGNFQERMEANTDFRRQCAPGAGAQGVDAG